MRHQTLLPFPVLVSLNSWIVILARLFCLAQKIRFVWRKKSGLSGAKNQVKTVGLLAKGLGFRDPSHGSHARG
jgi:hypothetical protein